MAGFIGPAPLPLLIIAAMNLFPTAYQSTLALRNAPIGQAVGGRVTAPSLAEETNAAYLAKTPSG